MIVKMLVDTLCCGDKAEVIGRKIRENIPVMWEFNGNVDLKRSCDFMGYCVNFEVKRIIEGEQYLLWR